VHHKFSSLFDFFEKGLNSLLVEIMKKIFSERQNRKEGSISWGQMRQLFVPSCIALVFAMLDSDSHFLFNILLQLYTKQIHGVNAVIVKPGLGHIKIDDGLAEIF
jgi:hypothetical protein